MEGVVGWFAKRGEVPLVPPSRLREYAPIDDDPNGGGAFTDEKIHGVAFALEYCDDRGWASTRTVRCLAVDPRHPARLRAYCHMRDAERTFRFDRIISIADLRTGRILSSDEHTLLLSPYLRPDPVDRRAQALAELREATRDGVFALLQVAMPDGQLDDRARDIVVDYARAEAEALQLAVPPRWDIELWIDNLAPPLDAVNAAVADLLADKDKFARLLPSLMKIARHLGSTEEEDALRALIGEVRKHFRRRRHEWAGDLRATR